MMSAALAAQTSTLLAPVSHKHQASLRCNNRPAAIAKKSKWSNLRVRASGSESDRSGVSVAVKEEHEALSPDAEERASNGSSETTSVSARADESPSPPDSSAQSAQQLKPTPSASAQKAARDREAINALDAYFDKLKSTQPKKNEQGESVTPPAAVAATATIPIASEEVKTTAPPTWTADDPSVALEETLKSISEKIERKEELKQEDVEEMVQRVLEKYKEQQKAQGDDKSVEAFKETPLFDSPYDEWLAEKSLASPPTAVYGMIAINVAVFLFELASPEAVPGVLATSLPSLLGAKVNTLIEAGEWWRLITPAFLHSGILHLGVTTFFLSGMGAIVELMFGSLPFLVLYLASAVVGNIASFGFTPEVSLGASGPVYGLAAAYCSAVWKNREVIGEEEADNIVRGVAAIALLFQVFGTSAPIDGWTHIGASVAGLAFGIIAAPTMKRVKPAGKGPDGSSSTSDANAGTKPTSSSRSSSDLPFRLEVGEVEARKVGIALGVCAAVSLGLLQLPLLNELLGDPSLLMEDNDYPF